MTNKTYHLITYIELNNLSEFEKTKNIELLRQMPIGTELTTVPEIIESLKKEGIVLIAIEPEASLRFQLKAIEDFKASEQQQ